MLAVFFAGLCKKQDNLRSLIEMGLAAIASILK